MKKYISPEIEIKEFKNEEILTGSGIFNWGKENDETPVVFYSAGKIFD